MCILDGGPSIGERSFSSNTSPNSSISISNELWLLASVVEVSVGNASTVDTVHGMYLCLHLQLSGLFVFGSNICLGKSFDIIPNFMQSCHDRMNSSGSLLHMTAFVVIVIFPTCMSSDMVPLDASIFPFATLMAGRNAVSACRPRRLIIDAFTRVRVHPVSGSIFAVNIRGLSLALNRATRRGVLMSAVGI